MKNRSLLVRFISFIFRPFTRPFKKVFNVAADKTKKSIRLELIFTFGICLLGAIIIYGISNNYFRKSYIYRAVDYESDVLNITSEASNLANDINTQKISLSDTDKLNALAGSNARYGEYKVMITDLEGKVLYKNENVSETQVDVYSVIKEAMDVRKTYNSRSYNSTRKEVVSFYPLKLKDNTAYLIVKGIPQGRTVTETSSQGNSFFALILAVAGFVLIFIFVTNKKMRYIEEICSGIVEVSKGNLNFKIVRRGEDELSILADYINHMSEEIQGQIERERKAERTKSELITNVSHDLRTPLTSIMGYLGLIKEKRYVNEEQMNEYLDIAVNKTEKLKSLIEDLFEYTKLTNEGIKLYPQIMNLGEFLEQLTEELIPLCEENELQMLKYISAEKLMVKVDPDKIVRVFENLITNAIKYSYKPGKVVVRLYQDQDEAVVRVVNMGKNIPKEELPKLFERFYRVDKSRTTSTGGSGLGLAIAKNIVELSGGRINAECEGEEISFIVRLKLQT